MVKIMTKKQIALNAVEALKKEYPDAICSLEYTDPLQLLIATRLAAQDDFLGNKKKAVSGKKYCFPDLDASYYCQSYGAGGNGVKGVWRGLCFSWI